MVKSSTKKSPKRGVNFVALDSSYARTWKRLQIIKRERQQHDAKSRTLKTEIEEIHDELEEAFDGEAVAQLPDGTQIVRQVRQLKYEPQPARTTTIVDFQANVPKLKPKQKTVKS